MSAVRACLVGTYSVFVNCYPFPFSVTNEPGTAANKHLETVYIFLILPDDVTTRSRISTESPDIRTVTFRDFLQ